MKITASSVELNAQHSQTRQQQNRLSLEILPPSAPARPEVELSSAGQAQAAQASSAIEDSEDAVSHDPRLILLKSLIEALTGKEIRLFHGRLRDPNTASPPAAAPAPADEGGFRLQAEQTLSESETLSFQASGVIRTADGQEIAFQAELNMSRSFSQTLSLDVASGSAARQRKDPLVLNYAAPAATLSTQTFRFDIDADGQADTLNRLNAGSAFLALDRNQDGKVNDGRELFGAQSGDGFADLAALDSDGNQWLDSNDAGFARLRLWLQDDSGQGRLVDLASLGIGALYLGRVNADFSLNDHSNQQLGQARSASIYLKENGGGGTVQQIDLLA